MYSQQIAQWRSSATQALAGPEEARASPQQTRDDRRRIKELERELRRKDHALAETAALLVLSRSRGDLQQVRGRINEPRFADMPSARIVRALADEGVYVSGESSLWTVREVADLFALVKPSGARSSVLRTMVGARRAELGLGGFPTVTLAQAPERAREALDQIRAGTDPAAERRAARQTVSWTFKRTALAYIVEHRAGWKNTKHPAQWECALATCTFPQFGE